MKALDEVRGHDVGVHDFEAFHAAVEPRLRHALVAAYGSEVGREAAAEALVWAWEHRDKLAALGNPVAYLYQVGRSRIRWQRRRDLWERSIWSDPWVEPKLTAALRALPHRQRVTVVLILAYEWNTAEVAKLLDLQPTTVQTHLARGLQRLRAHLGVTDGI